MWHIYFIMWLTGSGKWTLIKNLEKLKIKNVIFLLLYKTRNIRENEINWVDANFVSKEEFVNWIDNHEFLEYAIVHQTDYYGTKYKDVLENWIEKEKIVIKEIDILGLKRLRKEKPELDWNYSTVFLNIPICELKNRIESRWVFMCNQEFERRQNSAIMEEEEIAKICDFEIDATLSPEKVLERFLKIINK